MDKRKKHAAVLGLAGVLSACTMIGINARPCNAAAVEPTSYSVRGGTAWIEFDMWTLEELGLEFVASGPDGAHVVEARAGFPLDPSSTLPVAPAEDADARCEGARSRGGRAAGGPQQSFGPFEARREVRVGGNAVGE